MHEWLKISGLLCVFGFLREIRPSEPYVTEFILGPWRNVTSDQVNRDVYPVGTYSYLSQLVIVFLITDLLRYKPLIIISGLSGIVVWCLLIWTTTLGWLQAIQFFYGTYMASEVAYYTYIYAKVDKEYYSKVTSHTRAAMLIGKFVASVSSQILINMQWMNYKELNYITLATQIAATFWAVTLPNVNSSLYFNRTDSESNLTDNKKHNSQQIVHSTNNIPKLSAIHLLWSHFKNAYTNLNVIKWSLWYSLALCGYLQVITYIQVLWKDIEETPSVAWNGAVDAVLTFIGAIFALLAGYAHTTPLFKIKNGSLFLLSVLSIIEGSAILLATWTRNLYYSYIGYIIFGAFYAFSITIASAEVAKNLEEESFGLVFGINTLIGLILQTILTLIVISETGFEMNVYDQYTVYSFYYIVIGLISICCVGILIIIKYFGRKKIFNLTL